MRPIRVSKPNPAPSLDKAICKILSTQCLVRSLPDSMIIWHRQLHNYNSMDPPAH